MTKVTEATGTVNEAQVANGSPCDCSSCNPPKEKTLSEMFDQMIGIAKSNLEKNEKRRVAIQEQLDTIEGIKKELESSPYPEATIAGIKLLAKIAVD